ncbi:hypothetical protein JXB31_02210 [Candidatus Woesearchaeota archaeon]|nr:hypothetical protein [Candidatus Woesearchaeota archaeon]
MAFSARFPKKNSMAGPGAGLRYGPKAGPMAGSKSGSYGFEEIFLSEKEESAVDEKARQHNISLIRECIGDAKAIFSDEEMKAFQTSIISIAIALFEKRASHTIYWKERFAKDLFDEKKS